MNCVTRKIGCWIFIQIEWQRNKISSHWLKMPRCGTNIYTSQRRSPTQVTRFI